MPTKHVHVVKIFTINSRLNVYKTITPPAHHCTLVTKHPVYLCDRFVHSKRHCQLNMGFLTHTLRNVTPRHATPDHSIPQQHAKQHVDALLCHGDHPVELWRTRVTSLIQWRIREYTWLLEKPWGLRVTCHCKGTFKFEV